MGAERRLPPLKSLGQHFLSDPGIARRIVEAAHVGAGDTVLEIGPGRGILTRALLDTGATVTAVEIDRGLHDALAAEMADEDRLTLHHNDALRFDPGRLGEHYKVVANLPYQVTTPLLFHLLEASPPPDLVVVMIQKEVADRIVAEPGSKTYGVLSLGVMARGEAKRCFTVPPGAFRPPPRVKSAVIRVDTRPHPALSGLDVGEFMKVVRAALGTRRKTLNNALGALGRPKEAIRAALNEAGIDPSARGETLNFDNFARLAQALAD